MFAKGTRCWLSCALWDPYVLFKSFRGCPGCVAYGEVWVNSAEKLSLMRVIHFPFYNTHVIWHWNRMQMRLRLAYSPLCFCKTPSHMVCLILEKWLVYVIQAEQIDFTVSKEVDELYVGEKSLSWQSKHLKINVAFWKSHSWCACDHSYRLNRATSVISANRIVWVIMITSKDKLSFWLLNILWDLSGQKLAVLSPKNPRWFNTCP